MMTIELDRLKSLAGLNKENNLNESNISKDLLEVKVFKSISEKIKDNCSELLLIKESLESMINEESISKPAKETFETAIKDISNTVNVLQLYTGEKLI